MLTFRQYITEAASRTKFGQHAKLIGMQSSFLPRASNIGKSLHGWLHPDGTFYDAGAKQHRGTAKALVKLLPASKQGKFEKTNKFLQDQQHIDAVIKHHKVAQIGAFSDFLSVSTHHPLTAAQTKFLKDAVFKQGYSQIERKHKNRFHFALSKRKKNYVADAMNAISAEPKSNYQD